MGKREMIERAWEALRSIMGSAADVNVYDYDELYDNLAEQIVIECEVEQGVTDRLEKPWTTFVANGAHRYGALHCTDGHHGTQGKAIAIIVPVPRSKG